MARFGGFMDGRRWITLGRAGKRLGVGIRTMRARFVEDDGRELVHELGDGRRIVRAHGFDVLEIPCASRGAVYRYLRLDQVSEAGG